MISLFKINQKLLKTLIIIEGILFVIGFSAIYIVYINNKKMSMLLILLSVLVLVMVFLWLVVSYISNRKTNPKEKPLKKKEQKKELDVDTDIVFVEEIKTASFDSMITDFEFVNDEKIRNELIAAIFSSSVIFLDAVTINYSIICANIKRIFMQDPEIIDCVGKKDIKELVEINPNLFNIFCLKNTDDLLINSLEKYIIENKNDLDKLCFIIIKEGYASLKLKDYAYYLKLENINPDDIYDYQKLSLLQFKELKKIVDGIDLIEEEVYQKFDDLYQQNYNEAMSNRFALSVELIANILLELETSNSETISILESSKMSFIKMNENDW